MQNINVNIIPNELSELLKIDPEFVKKYLADEQAHRHSFENDMLMLEKNEQEIRKTEIPHYGKFAFRGQMIVLFVVVACLGIALYSTIQGGVSVALASILTATLAILPQILGFKKQKKE